MMTVSLSSRVLDLRRLKPSRICSGGGICI